MNIRGKDPLLNAVLENVAGTFHGPEGVLKHPYLDPGGVYSKSLWDWDSFWTLTGLIGIAGKNSNPELKREALKYGIGALNNFFDHQAVDGSIPILLTDKDPDCFDCRKSDTNNMAKPVMGQFCWLVSQNSEELPRGEYWVSALDKFYGCYERRYLHVDTGLYLWANDIAIGVDDDPATWGRPPFSSASIFLNCFMYSDLRAAAKFAAGQGNLELAESWNDKAANLAKAVQEFCWDERDGMFYSADVLCKQNLSSHRVFGELNVNLKPFWKVLPVKVMSWNCFLPMWCGIATDEQSERMVNAHLVNERRFWSKCGIRSLSADEKMYSPADARGNPSNWLGPVWIISNYLVWQGLRQYGYDKYAGEVSGKINDLLIDDYSRNNLLHENYNPETGAGISGPGFWNWNILACLMK